MKIEVWSDYVCPFCYIGKRKLEQALEQLSLKEKAEITYKSFELDPEAKKNTGMSINEKLASKYGRSLQEAEEMTKNMTQQAAEVGLNFQFDKMIPTNTFDAHRIAKLAEQNGVEKELTEQLFQAVFTYGIDIGDREELVKVASQSGLSEENVLEVLESGDFSQEVRSEESEAYEIGVQGVPFFVINRKYAISGAQPTEVFVQSLQKVMEEEKSVSSFQSLTSERGASCTDESC
ncbi:DsbA family oxidoreductase [Halobacillus sp. A1]|uniref:DsbA family oxidoreductase n=1 Tax=Halobacillus sp. A1 TaxID=2880262 RepID=UPI0020A6BEAC|nr:DsbA family oxidoreductase [Halobacillus sp. A1]MCP3031496.1 DsbA family oxidoreductase [Halobacillus sp. A1]